MGPAVKILSGLTGIGGVTSVGVGGVYFSSLEKVGSKLGDKILGITKEFDESWKSQFTKLGSDGKDLTKSLKKVKDTTGDEAWKSLRNWCTDTYNQNYKTVFTNKNEKLLSEAKKYCIQSLQERFTDAKLIDKDTSNRQSSFTSKYESLATHQDSEGILDRELKSLKEGISADTSKAKWTQLEAWCKSNYSKPFKGEGENNFKLIKKYCTK